MNLNFTQSIIFTFCLFLHSFATYGMDNKEFSRNLIVAGDVDICFNDTQPSALQKHTRNIPLIRLSQEFSKHIIIISLPKELSYHIFEYFIDTKQRLEISIKNSLSLSATCKGFNNLLPELGKLHQKYTFFEKDEAMKNLLPNNDVTYWNKRRAISLMIYAGIHHAKRWDCLLLQRTVDENDLQLTTLLFEHTVNPNLLRPANDIPIFFTIQNLEMAQLFIAHGVKLHESTLIYPNVLWYGKTDLHDSAVFKQDDLWWCQNKIDPELIKLYLEKGIDPRKIDTYDKRCLLHIMAKNSYPTEESQKIASMILAIIPDMINKLNKTGETPLDVFFRQNNKDNFLLELFKQYGAKMSQELVNDSIIENRRKNKQSSTCTIA